MANKSISDKDWANYKRVLNNFFDNDIGVQPITWLKNIDIPLLNGEEAGAAFTKVEVSGLLHYNYIKLWPYNQPGVSGTDNNMYFALYLSKNFLREQSLLINDTIDLDPEKDRFIINNHVYKPAGDSDMAQANKEPLWVFIILRRVDKEEAVKLIKTYL